MEKICRKNLEILDNKKISSSGPGNVLEFYKIRKCHENVIKKSA